MTVIPIDSYTKSDLAYMYNVNMSTLRAWCLVFRPLLSDRFVHCRVVRPCDVAIIFQKLGEPARLPLNYKPKP